MMDIYETLSRAITATIKDLLENRHLYQSARVEADDLIASNRVLGPDPARMREMVRDRWETVQPRDTYKSLAGQMGSPVLAFQLVDAKLFCTVCGRREPFNTTALYDFLPTGIGQGMFKQASSTIQVFIVNLQCQSCKGVPEVFLVRRDGLKLTICGRAPIEHVEVPNFIPKEVRGLYSGALVAHQSGQTLAGNFMLRTTIEQWSRCWARENTDRDISALAEGSAARVIEAYAQSLPIDLRDRLPSLYDVYRSLSDDLHAAKGDAEVFDKARANVDKHFEVRRVFDLDR